jgi:ribosomal protein S18 acetylase RimI-like enzyme
MMLRPVSGGDAAVLALLGAATFLESYAGVLDGQTIVAACLGSHSLPAWERLLARQGVQGWIAEVDPGGAPVGYSLLSAEPEFPAEHLRPGDAELRRIYVFSRFHGCGIGQALMETAIARARHAGAGRLLLGLHQDNHRAMAFYQRNGFREIGRRLFPVGNATFDDPVMALTL